MNNSWSSVINLEQVLPHVVAWQQNFLSTNTDKSYLTFFFFYGDNKWWQSSAFFFTVFALCWRVLFLLSTLFTLPELSAKWFMEKMIFLNFISETYWGQTEESRLLKSLFSCTSLCSPVRPFISLLGSFPDVPAMEAKRHVLRLAAQLLAFNSIQSTCPACRRQSCLSQQRLKKRLRAVEMLPALFWDLIRKRRKTHDI